VSVLSLGSEFVWPVTGIRGRVLSGAASTLVAAAALTIGLQRQSGRLGVGPGDLPGRGLAVASKAGISDAPVGGPADWCAQTSATIARSEYEASPTDRGLQAPNRAQNLRTYFRDSGLELIPRTDEGRSCWMTKTPSIPA
jgi:hypothetical protein